MRRGNHGVIGPYRTPTDKGIFSLSKIQQAIVAPYLCQFLLVGGGAGGGNGGGSGGGVFPGVVSLVRGTTYTMNVGAGGVGSTTAPTNGSNTTFAGLTALGGGFGGYGAAPGTVGSGASGGGATFGSTTTGTGTLGQGNSGGQANVSEYGSGGGGGANEPGGNGAGPYGGKGGDGILSAITGANVYYGGGGNGASYPYYGSAYGAALGGGGLGGYWDAGSNLVPGVAGGTNTGGGGGGWAANGGSGVGILRILTSLYTGLVTGSPTVTTDGLYTVIKFTSTGTYTA